MTGRVRTGVYVQRMAEVGVNVGVGVDVEVEVEVEVAVGVDCKAAPVFVSAECNQLWLTIICVA